jgi:hypothetical protein
MLKKPDFNVKTQSFLNQKKIQRISEKLEDIDDSSSEKATGPPPEHKSDR